MIPEIGHFALVIAMTMAFLQCVLPLYGSHINNQIFVSSAKTFAIGQILDRFKAEQIEGHAFGGRRPFCACGGLPLADDEGFDSGGVAESEECAFSEEADD